MNTSSFAIDVPGTAYCQVNAPRSGGVRAGVSIWFNWPVYTLALRLLAHEAEAYDLLQDSFLKAEQIAQYRNDVRRSGPGCGASWLMRR